MTVSAGILVERRSGLLVVTIARPTSRNAIDRAASEAIAAAMDQLDTDADLAVGIITGAGGHFCSGMDLKAFVNGERVELPGRGLAGIIETPPAKPLIAAVEGYALAGGCEIALACDLIVASDTAHFGLTEVRRGLIAGSGGLIRLPQRIPRQIAMEHALTGRLLSATEAARWGMVNRLCAPGEALATAIALAEEIAANAPRAVAMSKHIVSEAQGWPTEDTWQRQRALLAQILSSEDAKEGALAFIEKRPPRWSGR